MKKNVFLLFSLIVLLASLGFFGCQKKESVVITYNTPQQWVNWGTVLTEFTKKTSITAPNDNKNSGQTLTALLAEKSSPVCDVAYFGIVFGIKAAKEGVLAEYRSPFNSQIDKSLKSPAGLWETIHYGSIAFLVNTIALEGAPVPKSWADLLKPEYKGKIAFFGGLAARGGRARPHGDEFLHIFGYDIIDG